MEFWLASKAWRREATNPEDGLTIIFAASPESSLHGEEPPKSAEESKTYILNAHSGAWYNTYLLSINISTYFKLFVRCLLVSSDKYLKSVQKNFQSVKIKTIVYS